MTKMLSNAVAMKEKFFNVLCLCDFNREVVRVSAASEKAVQNFSGGDILQNYCFIHV